MVKRTWFHPSVPVLIGRDRINVNSLERAATILMSDDWPVHGPMCERAAEVLLHALTDLGPTDDAVKAFRDAAEEAGVLIR